MVTMDFIMSYLLQATEPESLIAFGGLVDEDTRIIIGGDWCQLGPTILSQHAKEMGLGISLMERLAKTCTIYAKNEGKFDNRVINKLIINFRSVEEIIRVPNKLFYDGELKTAVKKVKKGFEEEKPVKVIGVEGQEIRESKGSVYNREEVVEVIKIILNLRDRAVNTHELVVISPYTAQVLKIKESLKIIGEESIFCGTAEKLQGSEANIVIVSLVRNYAVNKDLSFVADRFRFNVMLTRAKMMLCVVAHPLLLSKKWPWIEVTKLAIHLDSYEGAHGIKSEEEFIKIKKEMPYQKEIMMTKEENMRIKKENTRKDGIRKKKSIEEEKLEKMRNEDSEKVKLNQEVKVLNGYMFRPGQPIHDPRWPLKNQLILWHIPNILNHLDVKAGVQRNGITERVMTQENEVYTKSSDGYR